MPASASKASAAIALVFGDDEFAVKQRAKQLFEQWSAAAGGMDQEIISGTAANSGEALSALAKLREALQTLPFFGGTKVVWFQNCNFLGDERTASSQAVTEFLANLTQELKSLDWSALRLLISAGKVDKRKTFYKTVEKIGTVEAFVGWSVDDRDWAEQAEQVAREQLQARGKTISEEALARLVAWVGPHARQLNSEVEKLSLFVGQRSRVDLPDVEAIVTRNKQSRAFALAEALGARDLPGLLRTLDEELWEMRSDNQKSEIGLLYGLISKVRVLIFLKELMREGRLKAETEYGRFKAQLDRLTPDLFPEDKRLNPLSMHPYILFKSVGQARHYRLDELVQAMDWLLECNQRLIFSGLDGGLILQQTLVKIVRPQEAATVGNK